jgi:membrane protease YdiL (CAAX protease family)
VTSLAPAQAAAGQSPAFAGSFQSFFDQPSASPTRFQEAPRAAVAGGFGGVEAPTPFAPHTPAVAGRDRIRWRWPHLWAFGFCAWGIPRILAAAVDQTGTAGSVVGQSLILQIVGYVLAVVVAFALVRKHQAGDWTTLGISRPTDPSGEILKGAAFGLLLLGAWMPIGYMMSGRRFELDRLMQLLVGETSGLGLLLAGVILVIGAPIIEEIYYRGMLYEKLARRSRAVGIIVSSILFVSAHGSPLILPLYFLAIGVAFMRKTKTLWFTMAAHGAWNLAVLCLAAFIIFSPAQTFRSSDGLYSLRHPSSWQRTEEAEVALPTGGGIDLVLEAGSGSALMVERFPVAPGTTSKDLPRLLDRISRSGVLPGGWIGPPEPYKHRASGGPWQGAWQVQGVMTDPSRTHQIQSRVVVTVPPGWTSAVTVVFMCPAPDCAEAEAKFYEVMGSFNTNI